MVDTAAWIKQGDSYCLAVTVTFMNEPLHLEDVDEIEFTVGGIRKVYPSEVAYNKDYKCFAVPLGQSETFSFEEDGAIELDTRVKFLGGAVLGTRKKAYITVYDAVSEVIL